MKNGGEIRVGGLEDNTKILYLLFIFDNTKILEDKMLT